MTKAAPDVATLLSSLLGPEIANCLVEIRQIADFDIPTEKIGVFKRFHSFITDIRPAYIVDWRKTSRDEQKWYHSHVNGILGDVRGALAATHYHFENLKQIESAVQKILAKTTFQNQLGKSSMAIGGTRKLDIEYQAFVLAYRRCLDYLAGSLFCYFKMECNSFRDMPANLLKVKTGGTVASKLIETCGRHVDNFGFVIDAGRSVRNRIAHYNFVQAGVINLNSNGFFIAGGGEKLACPPVLNSLSLGETLNVRLDNLHHCVDDMIDSFIAAAH